MPPLILPIAPHLPTFRWVRKGLDGGHGALRHVVCLRAGWRRESNASSPAVSKVSQETYSCDIFSVPTVWWTWAGQAEAASGEGRMETQACTSPLRGTTVLPFFWSTEKCCVSYQLGGSWLLCPQVSVNDKSANVLCPAAPWLWAPDPQPDLNTRRQTCTLTHSLSHTLACIINTPHIVSHMHTLCTQSHKQVFS